MEGLVQNCGEMPFSTPVNLTPAPEQLEIKQEIQIQ